ncbi:hypothetical protein BKA82DRAFT_4353757 [Pisolithus tinctorius]|nr:hypothetical protein BKA82DRAFT_4353757 [Pisolithus tinctorius]
MNALNYKEVVHKLLKIQLKEGGEIKLINMIIAHKSTLTPPSTALLGNNLVSLITSGWSVLNKHSTTTTIPFTNTRHPNDVPDAHLPHGETTAKVTVGAWLMQLWATWTQQGIHSGTWLQLHARQVLRRLVLPIIFPSSVSLTSLISPSTLLISLDRGDEGCNLSGRRQQSFSSSEEGF